MLSGKHKLFGHMRHLPIVKIGNKRYLVDARLNELRNVNNPDDREKMEGSEEFYVKNFGSAPINRSGNDERIIRQFFTKRFRRIPEADLTYYEEWRKRLTTYGPNLLHGTMDKQGRDILTNLRKEKGFRHPLTNFEHELSI